MDAADTYHAAMAERFDDLPPDPFEGISAAAVDAATVVPLRDGPHGLESLMLRRAAGLSFAGGMWVWPGGRIDDLDRIDAVSHEHAARRAAVREAAEEASLELEPSALVWFSHWTPPPENPKRYRTHFFAVAAEDSDAIAPDGSEMLEHAWLRPAEVLDAHAAGRMQLTPPTYITLITLSRFASASDALDALANHDPEYFATRFTPVAEGVVAVYHGDVASRAPTEPLGDLDEIGPRHRLWLLDSGWRYERST